MKVSQLRTQLRLETASFSALPTHSAPTPAPLRRPQTRGLQKDTLASTKLIESYSQIGKKVHARILKSGFESDPVVETSLLSLYGETGCLYNARKVFDAMSTRDVVSWSSILSTYVHNGQASEGLEIFRKMVREGVEIDSVTMLSVAEACGELGLSRVGKSSHGYVVRRNIGSDHEALGSSLVAMYGKFGDLCSAEKLFCNGVYQSVSSWTALISSYNQNGYYLEALGTFIEMLECKVEINSVTLMNVVFDATQNKHVISWNILISGYVRAQMADEALSLFLEMLIEGILPDSFALASALSACGIIGLSELGSIRIFHDTQKGSVITWNSMMCGFSQNGYSKEALSLFDEMYAKCLDMDEVTFLSVIQACSNLGFIDKGKWIHHKLITFGVRKDMYIDTALANMYARCGDLQMARRVFDKMTERSIVSWSSMIGSYAMHGHIDDCISVFYRMVELGIKPNDVTFMNILLACSHAGYVEKGKFYFNSMVNDFGVTPNSEHYACLVDLLSRVGDLNGAYEVINSMPFSEDASVWGALVNGCRIHNRMDFLKRIKKDLVNMDADDSGYYTLLSNVYAEGGKWNEFTMVKSKMRSRHLKKAPGYSMIEIESIHRFGESTIPMQPIEVIML
ncbi:hypothetical protein DH2020_007009 [Rehmannia glutinosa]|uniref:Pentatricopeptide repeat-containing protein n=1 Tax=Rehmannia glutinosa TaxID=99300 RepID=A0ABR0TWN1_REHGL